jgi:hypothetical protein
VPEITKPKTKESALMKFNPANWPQGLRVFIGLLLVVGAPVFPYLEKYGQLSTSQHAVLASIAAAWLLAVNTWNNVNKSAPNIPDAPATDPATPAAKKASSLPPFTGGIIAFMIGFGALSAGSMSALGVATSTSGCALLQSSQTPNAIFLTISDTKCVIDHDSEPVAQIVTDCHLVGDAGKLGEMIFEILTASRASNARALAASQGRDAGTGYSDAGWDAASLMKWHVDAGAGK